MLGVCSKYSFQTVEVEANEAMQGLVWSVFALMMISSGYSINSCKNQHISILFIQWDHFSKNKRILWHADVFSQLQACCYPMSRLYSASQTHFMMIHKRATGTGLWFSHLAITAKPPTSPRCTDDFRRFTTSSQTSTQSLSVTPTPSEVTNPG